MLLPKSIKKFALDFPVLGEKYLEYRHQRQTEKLDRQTQPIIQKIIDAKLNTKTLPLFTKVEIETINRCNHICPFCPVNRFVDPRPLARMSDELFKKIIDDLADIDYNGALALFSNNEPLIDIRLYQFLEYAKKKLPRAFHYLYTNGTLLTLPRFLKIMKYLDHLHIDNYNDDFEIIPTVKPIAEFLKSHPKLTKPINFPGERGSTQKPKVFIAMRKQTEKLTTRGGESKNRGQIKPLISSCILPFAQFIIRPDGKISLCCNDTYGKMTLGDLNNQTPSEVWYSTQYQKVRQLMLKGRESIPLCKGCDTLAVD